MPSCRRRFITRSCLASCGLILDDIIVSSIASAATYGRSAARSWNGRKEPREREVEQQLLLDDVHDVIVVEQLLRVSRVGGVRPKLQGRYTSSKKCNSLLHGWSGHAVFHHRLNLLNVMCSTHVTRAPHARADQCRSPTICSSPMECDCPPLDLEQGA